MPELREGEQIWHSPHGTTWQAETYEEALEAERDSLAAQVEDLLSQLERLQGIAENDREAYLSVHRKLDAAEQRARRAEEALLEVERCANGNASPEVLRRHVRRALSPTDPEEPDALT